MSDGSNIEITLKHFIDHFDKANEAMNIRLDQINKSVNELTGQKIIIHQMEKRITHLEEDVRLSRESIMILEHDAKKRDELNKSITTPLLQKGIWAATCCIFILIAGYGIKGVNMKSTDQMVKLMSN